MTTPARYSGMPRKLTIFLQRLLITVPIASLVLALLAWLRYGIDLPWFDDWRGYVEGNIQSLAPAYLFRSLNDTMSPVGFVLDALAQRTLDGNSIAYQFVSMATVLGALLLLQFKLLQKSLGNTFQASICFVFTALMLQPDSYWGRENLAYHQCLPLVFILWALWLMVLSDVRRTWHRPAVFILGLLAGFTYISGAFGVLSAGVGLFGAAWVCYGRSASRDLRSVAGWFILAGTIAVAVQVWFAILPTRGTHGGIPLALPHELQFWIFFLGKISRSLLLPASSPEISLSLTLLISGLAIGVAPLLVARARKPQSTLQERRVATLYVTVAALVLVYMMLVAAGRTNYRPQEMHELMSIFSFAFARFHFFWATLLWPWLIAAVIILLRPVRWRHRPVAQGVAAVLTLSLVVLAGKGGAFRHMAINKEMAERRTPIALCLLDKLQKGGEIRCPGMIPPQFTDLVPNASGSYAFAWYSGASFVRHFPLPITADGSENAPWFYQLSKYPGKLRLDELDYLGGRTVLAKGTDPKIFIDTSRPALMRSCLQLKVDVEMRVQPNDRAQLYFLTPGMTNHTEAKSHGATIGPSTGEFHTMSFTLDSDTGFLDPLRFDPVTQPQMLEMLDFKVSCPKRQKKVQGWSASSWRTD